VIFTELKLKGAFRIDPEPIADERGFFARTWSFAEFADRGLNPRIEQCSISYNSREATLRGMHYQEAPHAEAKLVRCTRGAIYDVALDLRPESPTFCQWEAVELAAESRRMLYIPEGFAHGFITLEDSSEVFYQLSAAYAPGSARGVRWDDPAFAIAWPLKPSTMSDHDRSFEFFAK
jgi:dTDP-4-dehydrorhamnose 3,5-epimerase